MLKIKSVRGTIIRHNVPSALQGAFISIVLIKALGYISNSYISGLVIDKNLLLILLTTNNILFGLFILLSLMYCYSSIFDTKENDELVSEDLMRKIGENKNIDVRYKEDISMRLKLGEVLTVSSIVAAEDELRKKIEASELSKTKAYQDLLKY